MLGFREDRDKVRDLVTWFAMLVNFNIVFSNLLLITYCYGNLCFSAGTTIITNRKIVLHLTDR